MSRDFFLAPPIAQVDFALEPLINMIDAMGLIASADALSGFSEWVQETHHNMPAERRHHHYMLHRAFYPVLHLNTEAEDVETYIDQLAQWEATALRDMLVEDLSKDLELDAQTLLTDRSAYLRQVEKQFERKMAEKGLEFERDLYADAHMLLSDPSSLKQFVVEHFRYMWETYLSPNWQAVKPLLEESLEAYRKMDYSGMTAIQAAQAITGRDLSGIWTALDRAERVTFVPSAHIGPYIGIVPNDEQIYVVFRARVPAGIKEQSGALTRSELLVHLNALADNTRLTILEMLTRHEELCAQDIINELNLSQSSASRHLRQLTATGYLVERRRDVAKCYSLNPERLNDTISALKRLIDQT